MATFLSSLGLVVALAQVPASAAQNAPMVAPDSLAALKTRVAQDSGNGAAWYQLGVALLRVDLETHARHAAGDTLTAAAILDSADLAFRHATSLLAGTRQGDSARVLRAFSWGRQALWAWETDGIDAASERWSTAPEDVRLPAVLEELGENLLRACPSGGVLIVRAGPDAQAATFLRMARHLRPDLTVVPYEVWREDSVLQDRVVHDLEKALPPRGVTAPTALFHASARRPLCADMGFERPPEFPGGRLTWKAHPLVWVTGAEAKTDYVPPQDFVFAALKLALDANDPWAAPAIQVYRRAAAEAPALCSTLGGFGVKDAVGCR